MNSYIATDGLLYSLWRNYATIVLEALAWIPKFMHIIHKQPCMLFCEQDVICQVHLQAYNQSTIQFLLKLVV